MSPSKIVFAGDLTFGFGIVTLAFKGRPIYWGGEGVQDSPTDSKWQSSSMGRAQSRYRACACYSRCAIFSGFYFLLTEDPRSVSRLAADATCTSSATWV